MGRVLRGTFKLAVIGGIVSALVVTARKLMGGLGPQPGSPEAPKSWPSLVPDQTADLSSNGTSGHGGGEAATATTAGGTVPEGRPTEDAPAPSELAPTTSSLADREPLPAPGVPAEGGPALTGTDDERFGESGPDTAL